MSIYGEGLYRDQDGNFVQDAERAPRTADSQSWDPLDRQGRPLTPEATPEWKQPNLASIYALGKYVQERTTLIMAGAYGMEGVCLRLFNVYGPGQALSNPYTGVLAIFSSRLLNGQKPVIFEDGGQRRDFVHVRDVAHANVLALTAPEPVDGAFNVCSGTPHSVGDMARALAAAAGDGAPEPVVTGEYRLGDVRHVFACADRAREVLGFEAAVPFADGVAEFATAPLRG
jgi:dTDP-L-rhamnose 4-epimerase